MIIATGFILLLVCANVANLLLAPAGERQKELAIRAALGAPRSHLVSQILMESLSLAIAGGLFGLFCAAWAMEWSRGQIASLGEEIPLWWDFSVSWETVGFTAVLVLGFGILVGLLPALRASSGDLNTFLRDGTRGLPGRRLTRFTRTMVGFEILLCATLLISSGVLVRSMYLSIHADFGVPTDDVLLGYVSLHKADHIASAGTASNWRWRQCASARTTSLRNHGTTCACSRWSAISWRWRAVAMPLNPCRQIRGWRENGSRSSGSRTRHRCAR
jgi:putative ABC transport system permease protein